MFSKACEYGIRACAYITIESMQNRKVKVADVAKKVGTPEAFTAKILSTLTKHNIVNSIKGPYGGFEIEEQRAKSIKIKDIVIAIDGHSILSSCSLGFSSCDESNPCPLHFKYMSVRNELCKMLDTTTLFEMAIDVKNKKSKLLEV